MVKLLRVEVKRAPFEQFQLSHYQVKFAVDSFARSFLENLDVCFLGISCHFIHDLP